MRYSDVNVGIILWGSLAEAVCRFTQNDTVFGNYPGAAYKILSPQTTTDELINFMNNNDAVFFAGIGNDYASLLLEVFTDELKNDELVFVYAISDRPLEWMEGTGFPTCLVNPSDMTNEASLARHLGMAICSIITPCVMQGMVGVDLDDMRVMLFRHSRAKFLESTSILELVKVHPHEIYDADGLIVTRTAGLDFDLDCFSTVSDTIESATKADCVTMIVTVKDVDMSSGQQHIGITALYKDSVSGQGRGSSL